MSMIIVIYKKKQKRKKTTTRLATSSHLYYFSQPTDLLLLKPLRNHLFRLSRKSTDKKKSITAHADRSGHSTREMGLKCQHLPRLSHISISPSPLWPCVGLPVTISIYLCIQSFKLNFSASDVMCTAGQSH